MSGIIDFVLEIIFSGTIDAASSKEVSLPLRILLGVAIFAFYICLFALLLYVGIKANNIMLIALSIIVFLAGIVVLLIKIIQRR